MAKEKNLKKKRPTALKRDIQNKKRRMHNRAFKSRVRTAIRNFEKQENEAEAKIKLNSIYSLLDKGVKMGIFKLNKVSRLKSKFSGRV